MFSFFPFPQIVEVAQECRETIYDAVDLAKRDPKLSMWKEYCSAFANDLHRLEEDYHDMVKIEMSPS